MKASFYYVVGFITLPSELWQLSVRNYRPHEKIGNPGIDEQKTALHG